jgi:hypothetical protein
MNYVTGRHQFIDCRGVFSETRRGPCEVPQGSILGPLLFNIYLTGLRDIIISHGIDYVSYADDLQLMLQSSLDDLPSSLLKLGTCISDIKQWFSTSDLALNDRKTEFITFGCPSLIAKLLDVLYLLKLRISP